MKTSTTISLLFVFQLANALNALNRKDENGTNILYNVAQFVNKSLSVKGTALNREDKALTDILFNAVKPFDELLSKLLKNSVDGSSMNFLYWNSKLGNDQPKTIPFEDERVILDYWDPGLPLKVITHGWFASDEDSTGVFTIKTAYVDIGGYNIITMDWSYIAEDYNYLTSVLSTSYVGIVLSKFLKRIVKHTKMNASDIHLLGHSLGAHVMGSCGAHFKSGKIGRITGLDPAAPGFEIIPIQLESLSIDDAEFVDVIHTCVGSLGYSERLGDVDFYPNGGIAPQPGCGSVFDLLDFIKCSHSRSYELYADSVYNIESLTGVECSKWLDYLSNKCNDNPTNFMGHSVLPRKLGNDQPKTIPFEDERVILDYWVPGLPLKVITHGWHGWFPSDENCTGVFTIKTAYVDIGGYNIITMDWSYIAEDYNYLTSVLSTSYVGIVLSKFLKRIVKHTKMNASDIHLLGHSLGAHVMGSCGAHFKSGKIGRITGLDPAAPGFEIIPIQLESLSIDDAEFVDVIHTCVGSLGYSERLGDVDFYPNGGIAPQPGCGSVFDLLDFIKCSHSRSYELYADSVYYNRNFTGVECSNWLDYLSNKCNDNPTNFKGHSVLPSVKGVFYGKTGYKTPFGVF